MTTKAVPSISLRSYLRVSEKQRWAMLQTAASLFLFTSTALVIAASLIEFKMDLDRHVTLLAMVPSSGGALLHAFIAYMSGTEPSVRL